MSPRWPLALLLAALTSLSCSRRAPSKTANQPTPSTCSGEACAPWTALLVSGGRDRGSNAVAHERNVLYVSRSLARLGVPPASQQLLVADGEDPGDDLYEEITDEAERRVRYAAALIYGVEEPIDTLVQHRSTRVPGAKEATYANVLDALRDTSDTSSDLLVYVTDHGERHGDLSSIVLWGSTDMTLHSFSAALHDQPSNRGVVAVMAQCFSAGFAPFVSRGAQQGGVHRSRCGFFAAPADRPAAGCSPHVDERRYDDYTTRFFAALSGQTRTGERAEGADQDGDGRVSFEEAHHAAIVLDESLDVPVTTSEELLRESHRAWLGDLIWELAPIEEVLAHGRPLLKKSAEGIYARLPLPPRRVSLKGLAEIVATLDAPCSVPGVCDAEEALEAARKRAREKLAPLTVGRFLPRTTVDKAVDLIRPALNEWVKAASAEIDEALRREAEVDVLRQKGEAQVARMHRLLRLVELSALEQRLAREGSPYAEMYRSLLACEQGGPWAHARAR